MFECVSLETCYLCLCLGVQYLFSLADTGQGVAETNTFGPTLWLTAFLSPFLLLFVPSQHTCLVLCCF